MNRAYLFDFSSIKTTNMAGPQGRSKPFRGKKPIKDLREFKSREIKKSLVHRARLRKNYFKLLEKEGESTSNDLVEGDEKRAAEEDSGDDDESGSEGEDGTSQPGNRVKRNAPLPPQRAPPPERRQKKPTNFAERSKLAKQKKEERRLKKIEEVRARRQILEKQTRDREKRKESLSKRTRSGQPLMGPRINNLLDKIKEDMK